MNISVLGAGSMGTALANVMAKNGHTVNIWDINQSSLQEITEKQTNSLYLPDVSLSKNIFSYTNIIQCIKNAEIIFLVIPSPFIRETVQKIKGHISGNEIIVNCAKGMENGSLKFMTEVIENEICGDAKPYISIKQESKPPCSNLVADLSGPSLAKEIGTEKITAVTIASQNFEILKVVKNVLEKGNDYFRVRMREDVIGVELGGIMKNIYALLIGMCDVYFNSLNTNAFVLDMGLQEMWKMGEKLGAKRKTFYGLSGVGDLIATCLSENSRNRSLGQKIGFGMTLSEALEEMTQVTEGVHATKNIMELAKKEDIQLPIVEEVHNILFEEKKLEESMKDLLKVLF